MAALAALLVTAAVGCSVEARRYRTRDRTGLTVSVERPRHACDADCDHVWNGETFVEAGHWHHDRCGHVMVEDRWVALNYGVAKRAEAGDVGVDHLCSTRCQHAWDGEAWVDARHRHADGCGHVLVRGTWRTDAQPGLGHTCVASCEHAWDGQDWVPAGHRHGPLCDHVLVNGRWMVGDVEIGHVCDRTCSHVWTGRAWVFLDGHKHDVGCGHIVQRGRWVVGRGPRR